MAHIDNQNLESSSPTRVAAHTRPALVISSVALAAAIGAAFTLPPWLGGTLLVGALVLALAAQDTPAAIVAGSFLAILGIANIPRVGIWPIPGAIVLAGLGVLSWQAPRLRSSLSWLCRGQISGPVVGLIAACAIISGAALVAWYVVLDPDVSDIRKTMLPPQPGWILALGGVGFSMLNAAVEEGLFRGLLLDSLERSLGSITLALVLQAASFGVLHLHGFPRGLVGVGLAATYGLMMGFLRRRSGGILAPWIAHVATDVTIIGILVLLP